MQLAFDPFTTIAAYLQHEEIIHLTPREKKFIAGTFFASFLRRLSFLFQA